MLETFPRDFAPKLIAIDIDDTLVERDEAVSERVAESIARVQAVGALVIPNTGRSLSTTAPVAHAAGMNEWAVCSNGAVLAHLNPISIRETVTFDPTELIQRITPVLPDAVYAVEDADGLLRTNKSFGMTAISLEVREVPFEHLLTKPVVRLVVRSDSHVNEGFAEMAAQLGLHSVIFGISEVAWMDIGPANVNKSTMLASLCEQLDIDPRSSLVFGDSRNDRQALSWAGIGVAMGDADPETAACADYLTGSVAGESVADVLDLLYR